MKIPVVGDSSAVSDLLKLLGKTIIGAEGKITLKFEKQKVAELLMETPKLFAAAQNQNVPLNSAGKGSRK